MVQMSNKWFIAIFAVVISAVSLIVAGLFLGWFKPLEGFGGAFAAGAFQILAFLPNWVVQGWPQMLVGVLLLVASWVFFGYVFEQKQVIATLKGTSNAGVTGLNQTQPGANTIPISGDLQTKPKEE